MIHRVFLLQSHPRRDEVSMSIVAEVQMAQKTTPVRITDEAIRWARIASGYTGESVAEYVSRVVAERGRADATRLHAETLATDQTEDEGKLSSPKNSKRRPKGS